MAEFKHGLCPVSGKVCFRNDEDLHGGASRMMLRDLEAGRVSTAIYSYRCTDCNRLHLTHRAVWDGNKNRLVKPAPPQDLQRWAISGEGDVTPRSAR